MQEASEVDGHSAVPYRRSAGALILPKGILGKVVILCFGNFNHVCFAMVKAEGNSMDIGAFINRGTLCLRQNISKYLNPHNRDIMV